MLIAASTVAVLLAFRAVCTLFIELRRYHI